MTVDQATWRRTRKLGLTAHNPEKAFPGYTLYAPMFGDGTVYLLDMEGNTVHSWNAPPLKRCHVEKKSPGASGVLPM